jgi:cytochrome c
MRAGLLISLLFCAAAILAGCSKPAATNASEGSAPPPEAATASAPPTDAAQKAILATLPAAYQTADLDNGQAKFALCKACHTYAQGGETEVGPNLWGVFGRKAGSVPGFAYSDGLKALGFTWDADKINKWISNPRAMVPGTKMTYVGMESAKDRTDLVAYLKTVTTAPPK